MKLSDFAFEQCVEQIEEDDAICYEAPTKHENFHVLVWALASSRAKNAGQPITYFENGTFNLQVRDNTHHNLHTSYFYSSTANTLLRYKPHSDIDCGRLIVLLQLLGVPAKTISQSSQQSKGAVCEKCGLFDDYASYMEKHKQVRCFRCC